MKFYNVEIFFSEPVPEVVKEKQPSPVEPVPVKAAAKKVETEEELIDMKEHVNVIFIGHVGRYI